MKYLYRDECLVAVNKPTQVAVHKTPGQSEKPMLQRVRDSLGQHVYPPHRLDRATSGILLFALSGEIAGLLQKQFQQGKIVKKYLAVTRGVPKPTEGLLDHPIPRSKHGERVEAQSKYRVLGVTLGRFPLVEVSPLTGRYHQVRRHMKHLSCPLLGDVRYGKGAINRQFKEEHGLARLALHAYQLSFAHPVTGEAVDLVCGMPRDLENPLRSMGFGPDLLDALCESAERDCTLEPLGD